ncbi:MAG: HNH endonuclease [Lachnospiraceae bacterium]|nr:HNH endonuclease [Lachnospiraceae bacterium]
MVSREIPASIKRSVRRKSFWGCCKCGNPIIEYHHIIPWSIVHEHTEDNIVALCPRCHHEATCGHLNEQMVRRIKRNPYNKKVRYVQENFLLRDYDRTILKLGGAYFQNVPHILTYGDFDLISLRKGEDNEALLSAKFYDKRNWLVAEIIDNEWKTYIDTDVWDIQYSPGHLKINQSQRSILLDLQVNDQAVTISGVIYMKGNALRMLKNDLVINTSTVKKAVLSNVKLIGANKGIIVDPNNGSVRIFGM